MEKIGSTTKPLGVWQRLINFVVGLLNRSMTPGSEEVPEELASRKKGRSSEKSPSKPNSYSDSEIEVEFRHTTISKRWKQIDELGELIQSPEKDGLILSHGQAIQRRGFEKKGMAINHFAADDDHSPHKRNGVKTRGKGLPELDSLEPPVINDGNNAPAKSEIVIEEIIGKDDRNKNKAANISADETTKFSFASNLNEKFDAYISSRKKVMHRNDNLASEKP